MNIEPLDSPGFMNVTAHEQPRSGLRDPRANGVTAHVPAIQCSVQLAVAGSAMAKEHVEATIESGQQPLKRGLRLGFVPLVREAEPIRPGTSEARNPQPRNLDHSSIHVEPLHVVAGIGKIMVSRYKHGGTLECGAYSRQNPAHRLVVPSSVCLAGRGVPGRIKPDVPDQQDHLAPRLRQQTQNLGEPLLRTVNVT